MLILEANVLLYRGGTGKVIDWNSTLHDLQLCFGVKEFLVCHSLTPLVLKCFIYLYFGFKLVDHISLGNCSSKCQRCGS